VSSFAAEDREYFERELSALLEGLYGSALRLTRNPADAEDLVADTVAKAWSHFGTLQDRQCFRAWIFRILTNTFFSDCRRATPVALDEQPEPADDGEGARPFSLFERLHQPFLLWWSAPEQDFLNNVLGSQIEQAIDALPEAYRAVVVLHDLEEFTYGEIANMLSVPVGTVRSRLARGRALLQKALWEQAVAAGIVAPHPDDDAAPPEPGSATSSSTLTAPRGSHG